MRDGLEPNITAIITASASLVGLFLTLSGANTDEERAVLAKRFRKTYKTFIFEGIFNSAAKAEWPPPPELR
jgi:hypothetical protein